MDNFDGAGSENNAGSVRNSTSPVPDIFPSPESLRPTLIGEHYSVVAGHPLVAMIAADVLERGGTAIDAGVAAGLASNVIQADMCNFGGVAPILLRQAGSHHVWSISGVGVWSREVTLESYLERYKGDMPLGAPCSIVPAAPDAWITALLRFGTWSFADVAAPALRYAKEGFLLDRRTANSYRLMGASFKNWESSRRIYWPQNRPPVEGDRLMQSDLARLLQTLVAAEKGASREEALENVRKSFYEGDIAEKIVRWVKENGGWMTLDDLADFRNEVALAKYYDYRDWRMFAGDIYCQGPVILQTLSILAGFAPELFVKDETRSCHLLVEAMKLAFSDREKFYGDSHFSNKKLEELLSDDHVAQLRAMISPDKVLPDLATMLPTRIQAANRGKRYDTTNFTIIDAQGNAFACSASDTIDGNPILDGLGIMVSCRGVQSRLDPSHPAALAPGKRPRLTPAPALALSLDKDPRIIALSASGGDVIVQGIVQTFLNIVDKGMSAQQAVEAPRLVSLAFPDSFFPHFHDVGRLSIEARLGQETRRALELKGHRIHLWPDYEFDASGVAVSLDMGVPAEGRRILGSGADPRRSHYALSR